MLKSLQVKVKLFNSEQQIILPSFRRSEAREELSINFTLSEIQPAAFGFKTSA